MLDARARAELHAMPDAAPHAPSSATFHAGTCAERQQDRSTAPRRPRSSNNSGCPGPSVPTHVWGLLLVQPPALPWTPRCVPLVLGRDRPRLHRPARQPALGRAVRGRGGAKLPRAAGVQRGCRRAAGACGGAAAAQRPGRRALGRRRRRRCFAVHTVWPRKQTHAQAEADGCGGTRVMCPGGGSAKRGP
eukprot:365045-Chlamydomonas_euryale.AAC.6